MLRAGRRDGIGLGRWRRGPQRRCGGRVRDDTWLREMDAREANLGKFGAEGNGGYREIGQLERAAAIDVTEAGGWPRVKVAPIPRWWGPRPLPFSLRPPLPGGRKGQIPLPTSLSLVPLPHVRLFAHQPRSGPIRTRSKGRRRTLMFGVEKIAEEEIES
ncbi:V-type proton ATPase subunit a [Psidium guajava]|nr:V-type proton ATPase subunit a [Psidium guajava]